MDDRWIKEYNFKNDWRWRLAYTCDRCGKDISVASWYDHKAACGRNEKEDQS